MSSVLIKKGNLDPETYMQGDVDVKIDTYKSRRAAWNSCSLTACGRNQPHQHRDSGLLELQTVKHSISIV